MYIRVVTVSEQPGPDYDFGSAPNEITYKDGHGKPQTIIGAGQKSGIYYALDPDTGATLWETQVGPGSSLGGMEWGSASDGQRIYVAIANCTASPTRRATRVPFRRWTLQREPSCGRRPIPTSFRPRPDGRIKWCRIWLLDGSSPTAPTMFAMDASSGKTLWSYAAGSRLTLAPLSGHGVLGLRLRTWVPAFTGTTTSTHSRWGKLKQAADPSAAVAPWATDLLAAVKFQPLWRFV